MLGRALCCLGQGTARFKFGLLCTGMEIPRRGGNSTWNGGHEVGQQLGSFLGGPDVCSSEKQLMSVTCQKQFQPFGKYSWTK